ncbi:MAG: cell division protein CrgA [Actinomycetes bacterium]|nr:cell division protein CrgA [Candidatus Nanopelagicales bacterium]MDP4825393.1 cell division protein CrgA [Candidatus Nanopelagicales bacterium]MDP4887607.1 cell division protein CrgA [Candidatus Nanopelagicales bacterium]
MPESKGRKKDNYEPPAAKNNRTPVKLGSGAWVAPTMVALFIIGLVYIVIFYIAGQDIPIMRDLNPLVNVIIGFAFITGGFVVSTRWK